MATKKKTSSKNISRKVHALVKSDVTKSVAIASILLNILFLVSIFVLTSTDTFDRHVYQSARTKYCTNVTGAENRAEELGSEKAAIKELQIDCVGKDFQPFYNEALQKYNASLNQ